MAGFESIKEQKNYELGLGVIDQNGYYARTPGGEIAVDGTGMPVSKAGIKPTADQLTPRTKSTAMKYTKEKGHELGTTGLAYPDGTDRFYMQGVKVETETVEKDTKVPPQEPVDPDPIEDPDTV
jgi:hypothetical protein